LHYYRTGVKPVFRVLLVLAIILPLEMVADYLIDDDAWAFEYFHVTVFALIAALTVRFYLIILREVNEHKA